MSSDPLATPAFLDRAPVRLGFGTSGLRGLVSDITDLEAYVQVKGALRHLQGCGDIAAGSTVPIAGDLRPSTERILAACARAIVDSGCGVENAGRIPSPALLSHAMAGGRASVMVTGSHIPFDRNGIKIGKAAGEILKSDEAPIIASVERVRAEEYGRSEAATAFDRAGMLRRPFLLPPVDDSAAQGYLARYRTAFSPGGLAGLRVLVYQHSAVGRDILVRVLADLGAEVIAAGRSESFVPIDTENITDEQRRRIEALAAAAADAGAIDAVVSTDGDSDRPLVLAALPPGVPGPRLRFLPGDLLGLVVAEYLGADAVVVPISASDAIDWRMRQRGVRVHKTRIGSPWVIAGMDELRRGGQHQRIVGWEANGGFLLGSPLALAGGPLAALPTRDAVLPIVVNLMAAREQKVSLDALWGRLPPRFGRSGLLDAVPVAATRALMERLVPPGDVTEVIVDAHGAILDASAADGPPTPFTIRAEGAWQEVAATLGRAFGPALGGATVTRINVLDGVRVHFAGGDVAHIRPSGNAPQLRIYACCDSQARADHLVERGLAEPDGVLRRLLAGPGGA